MELLSNKMNKVKSSVIHDAGYLQLIDIQGYKAVKENDMVVCIPYLVESNTVLLRYENVPPFELVIPQIDKYVTVMSTVVEGDVLEALKKGLEKEFSIVLKDSKKPEILQPIFINKGNTAQYHICILPLMSYDYEMVREDDAKVMEMKDDNVAVNINEINNLIIYDLISRYTLDLFKKEYSLF